MDGDYCALQGLVGPDRPLGPGRRPRLRAPRCLALCLEVYYRYDKVFGAKDEH